VSAGRNWPRRAAPATVSSAAAGPHTDDHIIRRVRGGERHLYGELVARHRPGVRRIALLMLADGVTTDNVVQQTFVKAFERLEDFQPGQDFGRWINAITRNLVRDELKKASRERGRMALYRDYLLTQLSGEGDSARTEAQLAEALAHCRSKLPPLAARALQLRYDEELPYAQVARALGRSAEATRQIVTRARNMLRLCIQKRLAEP
jgi:RNA polymerase sigma-70 factor (ECF subfamily)